VSSPTQDEVRKRWENLLGGRGIRTMQKRPCRNTHNYYTHLCL